MQVMVEADGLARLLRSWICYRLTAESMAKSNDELLRELGRAKRKAREAWTAMLAVAGLAGLGWMIAFFLWFG
jgi:hypothetical protein